MFNLLLIVRDPVEDWGVEYQSWEEPLKVPSTDLACPGEPFSSSHMACFFVLAPYTDHPCPLRAAGLGWDVFLLNLV